MTYGFQACPAPLLRRCKHYTGLPAENRGRPIISWTKSAEFRQPPQLERRELWCLDAGARLFLDHELSPREIGKTPAFRHQFIESSAFDHPSLVEQQDTGGVEIGRASCRERV